MAEVYQRVAEKLPNMSKAEEKEDCFASNVQLLEETVRKFDLFI